MYSVAVVLRGWFIVDCELSSVGPGREVPVQGRSWLNPNLRKGCQFRRRDCIAHARSRRVTIIAGVARDCTFIRAAKTDILTHKVARIIAPAAIAHLRLPHNDEQRDFTPATIHRTDYALVKAISR
jgi:hypothetical protein